MEWYIRKGISLNLSHFLPRAINSGDWSKTKITKKEFSDLLKEKINFTSIESVIADVRPFARSADQLKIWSKQYFLDLAELTKIEK